MAGQKGMASWVDLIGLIFSFPYRVYNVYNAIKWPLQMEYRGLTRKIDLPSLCNLNLLYCNPGPCHCLLSVTGIYSVYIGLDDLVR